MTSEFIHGDFEEMILDVLHYFANLNISEINNKLFHSSAYNQVTEKLDFVVFYLCKHVFNEELSTFFIVKLILVYHIFHSFEVAKGLFVERRCYLNLLLCILVLHPGSFTFESPPK